MVQIILIKVFCFYRIFGILEIGREKLIFEIKKSMETIGHYGEEHGKLNEIIQKNAAERRVELEAVEEYLKAQEAKGVSRREILQRYMKDYYQDFLDQPSAQTMTKEERYEFLKLLILRHGIPPEFKENSDKKKAA